MSRRTSSRRPMTVGAAIAAIIVALGVTAFDYLSERMNGGRSVKKPEPATTGTLAKTFNGAAAAYDGDTLKVTAADGTRYSVRIWGSDTPELKQTCGLNGQTVPCGVIARDKMRELIGTQDVSCETKTQDRYQRIVAICFNAAGADLGREMIRQGFAFEYKIYTKGYYSADEDHARANRLGLWAMEYTPPDKWRACNLPGRKRPEDCPLSP